jgi:hypothetical protein
MDTLFKQENMVEELPINGEKDVVIVLRERRQDFFLHLPPFDMDKESFTTCVGIAVAIGACLYNEDKEFFELLSDKFNEYGEAYLKHRSLAGKGDVNAKSKKAGTRDPKNTR